MKPLWCTILLLAPQQEEGREEDLKSRLKHVEKKIEELEKENEELKFRLDLQEELQDPGKGTGTERQVPPNFFNPRITVFGNFLHRLDNRTVRNDDGDAIDDSFSLREVETDFRAAIDPYADGLLILAAEAEVPGEYEVAVEEGYATIKRIPLAYLEDPPLGMRWRVGRMRTEFGRINRLHLHDLPQSNRPLVHEELLGEEGDIADGVSLEALPGTLGETAFDATLQALHDGDDFAYLGNLRAFRNLFNENHTLDASLIGHYRAFDHTETWSIDTLYRWRPAREGMFTSFVAGGQIFYQSNPITNPFGYFVYAQYQIDQPWYFGVRWETTESAEDDRVGTRRFTPYVSWYFSEFLRLRFSYENRWSDVKEDDNLKTFLFEVNVVFGSHPPEPYWVNR